MPTRVHDWLHEVSREGVKYISALAVPHHAVGDAPAVSLRPVHEVAEGVACLVAHVMFVQSAYLVENDRVKYNGAFTDYKFY